MENNTIGTNQLFSCLLSEILNKRILIKADLNIFQIAYRKNYYRILVKKTKFATEQMPDTIWKKLSQSFATKQPGFDDLILISQSGDDNENGLYLLADDVTD